MLNEDASVNKAVVNIFWLPSFLPSFWSYCVSCILFGLQFKYHLEYHAVSQHCGSLHWFIWLKESQTSLSALTPLGEWVVIRETSTSAALCSPSLSTWILTMLWKLAWILHAIPDFLPSLYAIDIPGTIYFCLTFSLSLPLLWSSTCCCLPLGCLTFPAETCFYIHPAFQKSFASKFLTYITLL